MYEKSGTPEFIKAEELLKRFTQKTEPVSMAAYYTWGEKTGFEKDQPNVFLFDKTVRELLTQSALVFSENGGTVVPARGALDSKKEIFKGLMLISERKSGGEMMEDVQKSVEIVHIDAKLKGNLWPAETSREEWMNKLGMDVGSGYTENVGFVMRLGVVLTEDRRNNLASSGELKVKYRKLMLKKHPDTNDGDKYATRVSQDINAAYAVLNDENKFAKYTGKR